MLATLPFDDIPELVIIGSRGWYTNDITMLFEQDPVISKKVRILHQTNDEELSWLYQNAQLTIYPSMYEGWGLPVAESLAYGKVTLSSDASSMPEVGGDCADYFSPYDSQACVNLIRQYLKGATLIKREEYIKKFYKITTWEAAYLKIENTLKKVSY